MPELLRMLEVKDENLGVKIAVLKAIRSIDRKIFEGITDWRSFLAHQQSAGTELDTTFVDFAHVLLSQSSELV